MKIVSSSVNEHTPLTMGLSKCWVSRPPTAIPKISTEFHSLNSVGWFASSYFLTQMAFQPAFGHMFTDFSIKKVYMAAILLFEVGPIVCATASDSVALIVGRLIAGAGGGGL